MIVDYKAGNVRSVQRACQHLGMEADIVADPDLVRKADKLIFPGVGSAESAIDTLAASGLDQAIVEFYHSGKPLLGICLGLQIALDRTAEGGRECLGLVPGTCERFEFSNTSADNTIKVPQIGWNSVELTGEHPMLKKSHSGDEFYFVHSYYAKPKDDIHTLGLTNYGGQRFAAIIAKDNFFATQFHLEKSGQLGLNLLSCFADWKG
ncbi:MAG: imidazole glycerol phosphate synthase subunit HisH [Pseudomonadales bacterium]